MRVATGASSRSGSGEMDWLVKPHPVIGSKPQSVLGDMRRGAAAGAVPHPPSVVKMAKAPALGAQPKLDYGHSRLGDGAASAVSLSALAVDRARTRSSRAWISQTVCRSPSLVSYWREVSVPDTSTGEPLRT